ncbi:hypothetical protein [Mucilaginibacter dorajii]|uniref:Uncharacterized protein n=1 Tax=Mucilaginibacter dorajii TaxID=692994 RepID=A0ABP7PLM2_9SPHI|nr:hypothetical protein [Mucilaginibacter dorajii]MCS3733637.1 hypothetical protein [Mucilaginibacter dorajii]
MNIKEDFHHLIETIDDEQLLKGNYQLIQQLNNNQTGNLWKNLSETEKQELLLAYDESFEEKNLVSHEQMKQQHDKWLK